MKRREIIAVLLIALSVACCLIGLAGRPGGEVSCFTATGRSGAFEKPAMPDGTVSVNFGDSEELMKLPGIGETMAQAIITERETNGFFHYPEDLLAVKGIGVAKLSGIRALLDMAEE